MNIMPGRSADPNHIDRRQLANALRMLAIDAVEAAKSGHPGMPMGMADVAEALWRFHLKHNPADPKWPNRDRFVLSNGHGSMLLYGLLHLTGYALSRNELRQFRQLRSKTPGHPEYGVTPGVETTTGPLGQGIANAVGMALAERLLADEFNRPSAAIVDHRTFVFLGDGCLMEGISHEACALAGTLKLDKLVAFYDDNGISIDGHVGDWFADDTPKRFEAYGWRVVRNVDGHDSAAIDAAITEALSPCGRPTLVCCKTIIGWGSPKMAGTHDVHGAPLGQEEAAATRSALGWNYPPFEIPQQIVQQWDGRAAGAVSQQTWELLFAAYAVEFPTLASEFRRRTSGQLPSNFSRQADIWIEEAQQSSEPVATRKASQMAIERLATMLPELLGGSADLTGSNLTNWKGCRDVGPSRSGNYIHYGVREFGMTAIINGMVLHGGLRPFGGTFLVFSDYARNAIRMAALMAIPSILIFSHDSIGLGEDGPTHQPIEQTAALRLIPNLDVWRPCDLLETAVAWRSAVERRNGPSTLLLSRQALPQQAYDGERAARIGRGAYILVDDPSHVPGVVLIATGSEVALAVKARALLRARNIAARVVSMPSTNVFDRQDKIYRDEVLPPGIPRLAIEAGSTDFWRKYVGLSGGVLGIDHFGESAPAGALFEHFKMTPEHAAALATALAQP
jgi:transketolase